VGRAWRLALGRDDFAILLNQGQPFCAKTVLT
jgi:hypothetical protein